MRLLLMLLMLGPAGARAAELRVGVAGSPPFVVGDAERSDGLSVQLWKEVAHKLKLEFKLVRQPSVPAALEALKKGDLDIAVGPISITAERISVHDFTQPYFTTTMGILAPIAETSAWDKAKHFLMQALVYGVGFLLVVLACVGVLIWLAERHANEQHFPKGFARGVGEGMWFAIVTMTTVGYGDRVPVTRLGRVLAGTWMILAMIFASSLTASIATALTISQLESASITGMDSLKDRRVAVVDKTTGAELARRYTSRILPAANRDEAIAKLVKGDAEAVVFDSPQLEHYLAEHPSAPLKIVDTHQEKQNYGFALPIRSDLRMPLSLTILALLEEGRIEALAQQWIKKR